MLLSIDIGNTNIKFGVFDGSADNMVCSFSINSNVVRTVDEYIVIIKQMLSEFSVDELPSNCVISSVVPSLTQAIYLACERICNNKPFIIGTGTKTGFQIKIDTHSQLGADIVSNTAAAFEFCKPPFVVVDLGTATTVTAINSQGQLIGTAIAPGASVSLDALEYSAALLSDVNFSAPNNIIGKNSQDSIRSGAFFGHVFMIDGFIKKLKDELCCDGEELSLVGTGGLSGAMLGYCENEFKIVPDLTIRGAASLFYHNTGGSRNYTK